MNVIKTHDHPNIVDDSFRAIQTIFRESQPYILEHAGKSTYTSKLDGSPVTDIDVAIEKNVQKKMENLFPGLPIFGEETGYGKDLPDLFWLIDPIDGTKNFIANIPTFTCMAALIQNGETVASIIYNPSTNAMFTAQKDKGAFKNEARLNLSESALPPVAFCKERFIEELNSILRPKQVACEKAPTGGGYGFTMVAEGLAAARFQIHAKGYVHDYAPGALLIREAGGAILPILDVPYTYTSHSFVACHPDLESILTPYLPRLRELEDQK